MYYVNESIRNAHRDMDDAVADYKAMCQEYYEPHDDCPKVQHRFTDEFLESAARYYGIQNPFKKKENKNENN